MSKFKDTLGMIGAAVVVAGVVLAVAIVDPDSLSSATLTCGGKSPDLEGMNSYDKRKTLEKQTKLEGYKAALEALRNDTSMDSDDKQRLIDDIVRKIDWL